MTYCELIVKMGIPDRGPGDGGGNYHENSLS